MITLNGRTLTDFGVSFTGAGNLWTAAGLGLPASPRGLRYGSAVPLYGQAEPMEFTFDVRVPPPESGHQAIMDDLRGWLTGTVEIEQSDRAGRRLYGQLRSDIGAGEWLPYVDGSGARKLTLSFLCRDPIWYAKYVRNIAIAADTPTEITGLGTRPAWFEVIVPGAVTDFGIEYQAPSGEVIASLQTTGSISSGEYLRIDMGREGVFEGSGGSETDRHAWLTGSYGAFFALDPGDGVPWIEATDACVLHIQDAYA